MELNLEFVAIGGRLRVARQEAGLSQDDAAAAAGVARTTISNWEAGRNMPCIIQFRTLISLYGVTGHKTLYGRHPLDLTEDQAKELAAAFVHFSPGLRAKMVEFLMIIGAKWEL